LIKSDIETRRSLNQFGIIVWQYNEIWPTGGWGSIEYGTVGYTKGQVIGGRWKPLHYWYKQSIYSDVFATCGNNDKGAGGTVACYVKNDSPLPFKGSVEVSTINFSTGKIQEAQTLSLDMPAGAGVMQWFDLGPSSGSAQDFKIDGAKEMMLVKVFDTAGKVLCDNPVAFAHPKNMTLPEAKVTFTVGSLDTKTGTVPIKLVADRFALYLTLTTLAQGRFSNNAFVMPPGETTLEFIPFAGFDFAELSSSLRVEHAATYM